MLYFLLCPALSHLTSEDMIDKAVKVFRLHTAYYHYLMVPLWSLQVRRDKVSALLVGGGGGTVADSASNLLTREANAAAVL